MTLTDDGLNFRFEGKVEGGGRKIGLYVSDDLSYVLFYRVVG